MLAELIATEGVTEVTEIAGDVGIMALHGGLEHGTDLVAREVAGGTGSSLYAVIQPDDFFWHVPSTRYRREASAGLDRFLSHCRVVVSVHGFGRRGLEDAVLLGGSNRALADRIAAILQRTGLRVVSNLDEIPPGLRGMHPENPVNLAPEGGVQIELSQGVRRAQPRKRLVAGLVAAIEAERD